MKTCWKENIREWQILSPFYTMHFWCNLARAMKYAKKNPLHGSLCVFYSVSWYVVLFSDDIAWNSSASFFKASIWYQTKPKCLFFTATGCKNVTWANKVNRPKIGQEYSNARFLCMNSRVQVPWESI